MSFRFGRNLKSSRNQPKCFNNTAVNSSTAYLDLEYLVFGYISSIEAKLSGMIAVDIKIVCLKYYANIAMKEKFGKHGRCIMLNEFHDIAQGGGGFRQQIENTVYGTQKIDLYNQYSEGIINPKVYKWTFIISNCRDADRNAFHIGIDSSGELFTNGDFTNRYRNKYEYYAFSLTGFMRNRREMRYVPKMIINKGDCIELILDVRKKTFTLKTAGDKDNVFVFENVKCENVRYQLAVTIKYIDHEIQLIKYETE